MLAQVNVWDRWDGSCMEQSAWQESTCVSALAQGKEQPFYHVLVHADDWDSWEPGITYVAQELLQAPQVLFRAILLSLSPFPAYLLSHTRTHARANEREREREGRGGAAGYHGKAKAPCWSF